MKEIKKKTKKQKGKKAMCNEKKNGCKRITK